MANKLVIVESPAKARTIKKFLGRGYTVEASAGHVRDLPKSQFGVDIENNFEPKYITIRGKGKIISNLRAQAKKAGKVYLATDPDREGEAISWHLAHLLKIDQNEPIRIVFHEITKDAIKKSLKSPRSIDQELVDAQQARRILDRIVGYEISPILWQKVKKGLSAGRVQSVALRLICEREREIEEFEPEEYWSIHTQFASGQDQFEAELAKIAGRKPAISSEEEANELVQRIKKAAFTVAKAEKSQRRKNPLPPFTTSTLQQEASKRLNFSARKTMRLAQDLYEGMDVPGEGRVGLVTYIRTDSLRVADEAIKSVREYIAGELGQEYLPAKPNYYKTNKKNVQEAHEAIRPTSPFRTPESLKGALKRDHLRLYRLIWERFVASQMVPAVYDTQKLEIIGDDLLFTATSSRLAFAGFLKVYGDQDHQAQAEPQHARLPELQAGTPLTVKEVHPKQHFTQPPARYTEAQLVKTLEELGIGRPSTYAPTIETIRSRGYVVMENKTFQPTELGFIVVDLLKEFFPEIIDTEFTAELEEKLDLVETGEIDWRKLLADFYKSFEPQVEKAKAEMEKVEVPEEVTDEVCEVCGRNMVIKHGRYGKFLACPGFPECRNTKPLVKEVGVKCPQCGGEIVERRSKKGKVFYGCSNYPECDFVSWYEPSSETCPECGKILVKKRRKGKESLVCIDNHCGYKKDE
ncbi:MAG: type I DNA topoisomerase [Firmicutes bacterium]|nr:type I DNA topoisomerase [Bacillota bacterium]